MTNPFTLYFELDNEEDLEEIKTTLENGLAQIQNIEESEVQLPEQRVTGAEIVAVLGVAIVIAKSAKEAVDAIDSVISSLSKLIRSIKGLKSVTLETPSGPKPLDEATKSDIKKALGE